MPIGEIKVTFGGLEAAAGNITTQAGKVQSALDDLKQVPGAAGRRLDR